MSSDGAGWIVGETRWKHEVNRGIDDVDPRGSCTVGEDGNAGSRSRRLSRRQHGRTEEKNSSKERRGGALAMQCSVAGRCRCRM